MSYENDTLRPMANQPPDLCGLLACERKATTWWPIGGGPKLPLCDECLVRVQPRKAEKGK